MEVFGDSLRPSPAESGPSREFGHEEKPVGEESHDKAVEGVGTNGTESLRADNSVGKFPEDFLEVFYRDFGATVYSKIEEEKAESIGDDPTTRGIPEVVEIEKLRPFNCEIWDVFPWVCSL